MASDPFKPGVARMTDVADAIRDLNDPRTHGYRWSDGTVRTTPEPAPISLPPSVMAEQSKPAMPHVTQATLDKAYADWLKEYTRWKADYAAWEAKHGKR